jgi:hypothetical protein
MTRTSKQATVTGLIMTIGVAALTMPVLNVAGFCVDELRFLPRSDLISKAIEATYAQYPPLNYGGSGDTVKSATLYDSIDQFILKNKGCCDVVDETDHQYRLSWLHKIQGKAAVLVKVDFRVEESANAGAYTGLPKGFMRHYHVVTNCGRAWNGI